MEGQGVNNGYYEHCPVFQTYHEVGCSKNLFIYVQVPKEELIICYIWCYCNLQIELVN